MYEALKLITNTPITFDETKKEIESWKKEGTLTEKETEQDGFITKTLEFISADGSVKLKRSFSERKKDSSTIKITELYDKLSAIVAEKEFASQNEDYEKAMELKKQQETILNQIKQIKNDVNIN